MVESDKKQLNIYTKDGIISILEIQAQGKKKMDIKSFLNGIQIETNTKAC